MGIYKCMGGGVHDGNDCHDEFGKYLAHPRKDWHDVRLVRLPTMIDLGDELSSRGLNLTDEQVMTIQYALMDMTPSALDDKDWTKLHDPSA
jgi:hypothetical protein